MAETDGGAGVYVPTAGGDMLLPAGLPDWVTADLVNQANAAIAPAPPPDVNGPQYIDPDPLNPNAGDAATPPAQGDYIQTPYGPLYVAPGQPDWVTAGLIDQMRQASQGPVGPVGPVGPSGPPAVGPVGPVGPVAPPSGGGLPGAARDVASAAAGIVGRAKDAIGSAAGDVRDAAGGILSAVGGVIDSLVPTIEELALGLTHRFAELAGFVADKTVGVAEYAATMATHAASALSEVLDDAYLWILRGLGELLLMIASPFKGILEQSFGGLQPGSL